MLENVIKTQKYKYTSKFMSKEVKILEIDKLNIDLQYLGEWWTNLKVFISLSIVLFRVVYLFFVVISNVEN